MRLAVVTVGLAILATPAAAADPVEGDWMVGSSVKVRISPCASLPTKMCGVITWLKTPNDKSGQPSRDVQNPDPKLRGRTIVGMTFIRDFRPVRPGQWTGGKIYDPDSGKTYASKMRVNPDGTLKVDGCVLVVCQSQTWRRAG